MNISDLSNKEIGDVLSKEWATIEKYAHSKVGWLEVYRIVIELAILRKEKKILEEKLEQMK